MLFSYSCNAPHITPKPTRIAGISAFVVVSLHERPLGQKPFAHLLGHTTGDVNALSRCHTQVAFFHFALFWMFLAQQWANDRIMGSRWVQIVGAVRIDIAYIGLQQHDYQSTSKLPPTSLQRAAHREQRWHIELHRPQLWVFHECQGVGIVTNCNWIVSSCKKLQESRQTPSSWKKRALQSYSHIPHHLPGPPTSEKIFKVLSHKEPGVLGRMHGTSCQVIELATLDLFSTRDPIITHISSAAHSLRSSPHPRAAGSELSSLGILLSPRLLYSLQFARFGLRKRI